MGTTVAMNKNTPLVIERCGNGFQVRPMFGNGEALCMDDVMVFQDKGYVSSARDYQKIEDTLFGWLDQHFQDVN